MTFALLFPNSVAEALNRMASEDETGYQRARRTLGLIESYAMHPSLKSTQYDSVTGPNGEKVFDAYLVGEADAPHVLWYSGPGFKQITVVALIKRSG